MRLLVVLVRQLTKPLLNVRDYRTRTNRLPLRAVRRLLLLLSLSVLQDGVDLVTSKVVEVEKVHMRGSDRVEVCGRC